MNHKPYSTVRLLSWSLIFMSCSGANSSNFTEHTETDRATGIPDGQCLLTGPMSDFSACGCDADCSTGARCLTELNSGIPGGACLRSCDADFSCEAGNSCVVDQDDWRFCLPQCRSSDHCPPGSYCDTQFFECWRKCTTDSDCRSGTCDIYTGKCGTRTRTSGGGAGAECLSPEDCRSRDCKTTTHRCQVLCLIGSPACPEGAVCVATSPGNELGVCRPRCETGSCSDSAATCEPAEGSSSPVCIPASIETGCVGQSPAVDDGANCSCESDCPPDAVCAREEVGGAPHGRCIKRCIDDSDCRPGNECVVSDGLLVGICYHRCNQDDDCPLGSLCSLNSHHCRELCQSANDCLTGICNPYSGYCEAIPTRGQPMGATCAEDSDCRSDFCRSSSCTAYCDTRMQACPDATVCADEGNGDNYGRCWPNCYNNDDCPKDWSCVSHVSIPGLRYCHPPE